MPRPSSDRRQKLAEIATGVAYRQGFRQTTLADVAQAAKVPLGSVYYYFKTKDDLGRAVIGSLSARYEMLREGWDAAGDPRGSLMAFVEMTMGNADNLKEFGCPIGSLSAEFGKSDPDLALELSQVFQETLRWMQSKFEALGLAREDASARALQLLSSLEGASLLSNMFSSRDPILREGTRLLDWLAGIGGPHSAKEV